ncbi:MAG: hypothetical protein ACR2QE_15815 [Acidimicrobiales bacterium]
MKKLLSTAVFSLASLALLAGCGESVDREGTIDQLMEDGGLTRVQAECMVDGWISELGEDRALELNDEEPTAEETEAISQITIDCLG